MRQTPLEKKISDIATPVIEDLGFALVHVQLTGDGKSQTVIVMAEDPETKRLGIDDCTAISKALSATMDVEDPIKGKYRLEVSSPGIDRPLTREEDFETYKGFEAKLETETPSVMGQRRYRGEIKGIKDGVITIKTDTDDAEIEFTNLVKAKLVLTDKLIKETAKNAA